MLAKDELDKSLRDSFAADHDLAQTNNIPIKDVDSHYKKKTIELEHRVEQVENVLVNLASDQSIVNKKELIRELKSELTILKNASNLSSSALVYTTLENKINSIEINLNRAGFSSSSNKIETGINIAPGINRPLTESEFGYVPDRTSFSTTKKRDLHCEKMIETGLSGNKDRIVIIPSTEISRNDVREKHGANNKLKGLYRQIKELKSVIKARGTLSTKLDKNITIENFEAIKNNMLEQVEYLSTMNLATSKISKLQAEIMNLSSETIIKTASGSLEIEPNIALDHLAELVDKNQEIIITPTLNYSPVQQELLKSSEPSVNMGQLERIVLEAKSALAICEKFPDQVKSPTELAQFYSKTFRDVSILKRLPINEKSHYLTLSLSMDKVKKGLDDVAQGQNQNKAQTTVSTIQQPTQSNSQAVMQKQQTMKENLMRLKSLTKNKPVDVQQDIVRPKV